LNWLCFKNPNFDLSSKFVLVPLPFSTCSCSTRYHKRENAKRVRGYSAEDLAAILGASSVNDDKFQPMDCASAAIQEVRAFRTQEDSDVSSAGHVSGSDADDEATDFAPASSRSKEHAGQIPKSWWSGIFVRAGRMGSTKRELHKRKPDKSGEPDATDKVVGFNEKDQENLFTQVCLAYHTVIF
jgi:Pin2-interacting protein X1